MTSLTPSSVIHPFLLGEWMYSGFVADRLGASVLPAKPAESSGLVSLQSPTLPASTTHLVTASPGLQVAETSVPRSVANCLYFFQSPDAADADFIDDGSSNPGM